MIPIFSTTEPSFLGLDSSPQVPIREPKFTGFEEDAYIAMYAHSTLESEIGFDIIYLVDGELQNIPEQICKVISPDKEWDAVVLVKKRDSRYWHTPKPNSYYAYAVIPKDVELSKEVLTAYENPTKSK